MIRIPDPSDWPDEREYARSSRSVSELGSGSQFAASSRLGASSHAFGEDDEEMGSVTYEVRRASSVPQVLVSDDPKCSGTRSDV